MKKGKKGTDHTGLFWDDLGCKGWYEAYLRSPKKFLPDMSMAVFESKTHSNAEENVGHE